MDLKTLPGVGHFDGSRHPLPDVGLGHLWLGVERVLRLSLAG